MLGSQLVSGELRAIRPDLTLAFWSALTVVMTLTTVSCLMLRWKWLCFEWQCRLPYRCQQGGEHGVQIRGRDFLRGAIEKSGVRIIPLSHCNARTRKMLRAGARAVQCTVHKKVGFVPKFGSFQIVARTFGILDFLTEVSVDFSRGHSRSHHQLPSSRERHTKASASQNRALETCLPREAWRRRWSCVKGKMSVVCSWSS